MTIQDLKVNHLVEPMGYDSSVLTLSWKCDEKEQKAETEHQNEMLKACVTVTDEDGHPICQKETNRVDACLGLSLPTDQLRPRTCYRIRLTLNPCTAETTFETGKRDESWYGAWITSDADPDLAFFVQKTVTLRKKPERARMYVCGLGLYEVWINGEKAGQEVLSPGYHAYDRHLQIDTLDVTNLLKAGDNDVRIYLGDGWYRGRLGFEGGYTNLYGDRDGVLAELWTDDVLTAATDTNWTWHRSPIRFSNIYDGEIFDPGFLSAKAAPLSFFAKIRKKDQKVRGGQNSRCDQKMSSDGDEYYGKCVLWSPKKCGPLTDRVNPPILADKPLEIKEIIHTPKGETVLDFGQEVTGWMTFEVPNAGANGSALGKDEALHFTAGEILQDGNFFHKNYRTARAQFAYVSDGQKRSVRPHFTFYGFRYLRVELLTKPQIKTETIRISEPLDGGPKKNRIEVLAGLDETARLSDDMIRSLRIRAIPISSRMKRIGQIQTGDPKVNRLYENVIWGQRDNFLDVPTDCPQRDERLGWTGDAQIFSETACLNFDTTAFYRKYMWDMRSEQRLTDGSVPNVVPRLKAGQVAQCGISPWADAGVIIPWNVYRQYGDLELLKEMYPGMKAWVDYTWKKETKEGGPHLIKNGFSFGDWLALDNDKPGPFGATDPLFIASAYYYQDVRSVAAAAQVLSKEEAGKYEMLASEILSAIRDQYFDQSGLCTIRTQTASAVSVMMHLNPTEELRQKQGDALAELVHRNNDHLNTGFVGTAMLLPALSETGHGDLAVTLLLNRDYPSWLYAVDLGATTIWERWNSVMPDGHLNLEGMNSLNHYSYGSIAGWMYRYLGGIREVTPGYRTAVIGPVADPRFQHFEAKIDTASGTYISRWFYQDHQIRYDISVPYGCIAHFRAKNIDRELENGRYMINVSEV